MSFGWALLMNGAIGFVVFYATYIPFRIWLNHRYGWRTVDEGLNDAKEESDMVGDYVARGRMDLWTLFACFMTFFLWEIELPMKYYMIWTHVKALEDIREQKEEEDHV